MHAAQLNQVVRRIGAAGTLSDRQLLVGFSASGDQSAFAALVGRHGPMVLRVCRRVLRHEQDAEDAFQATFLVLARKAGSIRRTEGLASWLHGVAHRVSLRARRDAGRRRTRERAVPIATEQSGESDWREVLAVLDEEVRALPEAYRGPFVLCFLEGRSRAEAAAELGLKEGTVWSRLSHARALLRHRLACRGIELPALLAAAAVSAGTTHAQLFDATARSVFSARAAALAKTFGGFTPMGRVTVVILSLVATGFFALGGALPKTAPPAPLVAPAPAVAQKQPAPDPEDPKFAGHFRGRVFGPDGKPLSGAAVRVVPFHGENKDAGPVRATTDADGRFAFDAPDLTYTAFDGLPARREGLLVATKDGYAADWFHTWGTRTGSGFRTHWDPVKGAEVALHLPKDDVPIRGRFLGPDGKPLAGAQVRVTMLMIPRERNLDAHLDREKQRSLYTLVDYERSIRPVRVPGVTAEARTDADGRFTFTGLGRDRLVTLRVTSPAVIDTDLVVMTRDAPDVGTLPDRDKKPTAVIHGAGFTLPLKRGLSVTGVVRDRDTKAPIPGMWVPRHYNPLTDPTSAAESAVTDENGRFTLTGMDPDLVNWKEEHRAVIAVPRPGVLHLSAFGGIGKDATAVIECVRGVPFRLKLTDEQGKPAEGTVEYWPIDPNPQIEELIRPLRRYNWPIMSRAARKPDGTYEGFALPGPGAVVVEMPNRWAYRPARVDPKAFFEPRRADWPKDSFSLYGTHNTLATGAGWRPQSDSAAIVLVNPAKGAAPLELTATIYRDRPRRVDLTDPDGKPVVGATAHLYERHGPYEVEERLRTASFPLTGLHPDRVQRVAFVKADRKLVGFLKARGDGDTPYTVQLQPWASVTGRLVDENGRPLDTMFGRGEGPAVSNDDPAGSGYYISEGGEGGRFRIDGLVPGQSYSCLRVHRFPVAGFPAKVFEKLTLRPGEIRDLGDIRVNVKPGK